MIYSILVLTIGVFLGQEYKLPLIKNSVLYIYNLLQESKKEDTKKEDTKKEDTKKEDTKEEDIREKIQKGIFSYFKF
jgi:hypothetical protein